MNDDPLQISEHLHIEKDRLFCHCGCGEGTHPEDFAPELLKIFEDVRKACGGRPIFIKSAYRCALHNVAVKGSPDSLHKKGMALDTLPPAGMSYREYAKNCSDTVGDRGAVIQYKDHRCLHFDCRGIGLRLILD